jgi:hypothetical protein
MKTLRKMAEFWLDWTGMKRKGEINRLVSAVSIWLSSVADAKRKQYFLWAGQALARFAVAASPSA